MANYRGTDEGSFTGSYGDGPKGEYRAETTDVGSFPANTFGLYDMHGNVLEWCKDDWHGTYYGAPTDGSAWPSGNEASRVLRGGAWYFYPKICRSAIRDDLTRAFRDKVAGFRVSCSVPSISN